jgi:hypothetical protein
MKEIYSVVCGGILYGYLCVIGKALFSLFGESGRKYGPSKFFEPVLGLAFVTIVSTYVSFASIPFSKASLPSGVFILLSAFLILRKKLNNEQTSVCDEDRSPKIVWALLITALFLSMPFLIGGYEFSVLRGNGTDSFNYVTIADTLLNYPLNWINSQNQKSLALISPTLPLASEFLQSRFSTSAVLAFVSALFRMAPIEFEYVYTLVLSLLFVNAITGLMAISGFKKWFVPWIASIATMGFWGQFLLDLRAFSHITAVPILITILGFILAPQERHQKIFSTPQVIISILLAAIWFQYPEICVAFLPLLTVILFERSATFQQTNNNFKYLLKYFIRTLALVLLIISPSLGLYIKFIKTQGQFAISSSLGWENAYFSWLHDPFLGFWGMGSMLGIGRTIDNIFLFIGILASAILTILVLWFCIQLWFSNKYDQKHKRNIKLEKYLILAYFLCAAEYYFLFLRNNPWSAGKVLSYFSFVSPCFVIIWTSLVSSVARKNKNIIHKYIATAGISLWGVWNIMFGGTRIFHALHKSDFRNYISGHGEYRRVEANKINQFARNLFPPGSIVAVFDPTSWGREFLCKIIEGNGMRAITPFYNKVRTNDIDLLSEGTPSGYLYGSEKSLLVDLDTGKKSEYFSTSKRINYAVLLKIESPFGLENNIENHKAVVLLSENSAKISIFSSKKSCILNMTANPVATLKANEVLNLGIRVNDQAYEWHALNRKTDLSIIIPESSRLINELTIKCENRENIKSVFPLDKRSPLIRIEAKSIEAM